MFQNINTITMKKVGVLSKWSFVNRRITVKWQFKLVDYSKVVVYKCKPADYSKVAVYKCKPVDYSRAAVYKCKPAVCTCKVLNSRFTTVLVITLLDTVEVTSFFQFLFVKQWFTCANQWFMIPYMVAFL